MRRKTIKKSITFEGVGLHSGNEVTITINPVEIGDGIKFQRIDLQDGKPINADISNLLSTQRCTTIGKEKNTVRTIEHLMACFYALGITDVLVKINNNELPILDGSSNEFFKALVGNIEESEIEVEVFSIQEPMHIQDQDSGSEYYLYPSDHLSIDSTISLNSDLWADQTASMDSLEDFGTEIAPARTYVFAGELLMLAENDLIKGGSLNNAIVLSEKNYSNDEIKKISSNLGLEDEFHVTNHVFNPEGMRFSNEPARHKILDVLGDLSLLGMPINAKIIAIKPGHKGNSELVKVLKKEIIAFKKLKNKPIYDPTVEPVVDFLGVRKLLPHRYPFLLVDKIIELTDTMVVGVKNITFNEGFFQGHFPDNPVFPGVLQMEALAQTGGILALSSVDDPHNWDTYFLKMDNVKFKNKVVPGDTLILKMELLTPIRRGIVHMQGTTYVGNKIVSEGELIAQIIRRK